LLLKVAAGDQEASCEAGLKLDRSPAVVREAAAFFVEQILLCPESDSYRVLGAGHQATSGELRHNMALLMKWLHPDSERHGQQSVYANRVTLAWEELKTPQRRAAYDERLRAAGGTPRKHSRGRNRVPASRQKKIGRPSNGFLRRALLYVLGGVRR
jgi:curved DNA-binding protein CbpA